jgi:hypothetical protein
MTRDNIEAVAGASLLGGALALVMYSCLGLGCNTPAILTPPIGPGTEWPCGYHGRVCKNSMCCGEFDVCGEDDPSCPANSCCFYGEDPEFSATRDGGSHTGESRTIHVRGPQRPQAKP